MFKKLLIFMMFITLSSLALAQSGDGDITGDDAYDPFADYSEFEASADEEADIHFFKNGRFFNMALLLGPRMFTQQLGESNDVSLGYGLYFAYFFDIRTALQISYVNSDHNFKIPATGSSLAINGNTSLTTISAHMKYYFNTQNITRGFADLNPYVIGGFGATYRSITVAGQSAVAKSSPTGIEFGAGLEVPIARNKMYLGGQIMYHYVKFSDENVMVTDQNQNPTGVVLTGDYMTGLFVLGINF
ncbi:porin family protein [bacterium]|nr:porin family protein [bacterium]